MATWDDFSRVLEESKKTNPNLFMSQYDLDTAKRDPNFGMSILSLKNKFANASTNEERLLLNAEANQLRSGTGSYSGGLDGSEYLYNGSNSKNITSTLDKIGSFGSFTPEKYNDPYASQQQQLLDLVANRPAYNNKYEPRQQQLLDALLNRAEFSYNKEDDPQWASYKKSYLREGDRATENALAKASAASGGRASTAAVTAATQAGDYYATKLNDVIPTLYQQAYDRYLKEYQMKQSDLNAVNNQEQFDYKKYLDDYNMNLSGLGAVNNQQQMDYSRFQDNREFDFKNHQNDYNMLNNYLGQLQGQDTTDYSRYLDTYNRTTEADRYQQEQGKSFEQQLLDNAMKMYQTLGYVPDNLADILGLPTGTLTSDQAYKNWNMQQKTSSGSSGGGTKQEMGNILDNMLAFNDDIRAQSYLFGLGLKADEVNRWMGLYSQVREQNETSGGTSGNEPLVEESQIDQSSILALGYGPLSEDALERLLEEGKVVGTNVNGKIVFKRAVPGLVKK